MDDLISRQSAIDAVTDELDMIDHVPQWVFDRLERRLKQLPPIQPVIVRCEECKYHRKKICPIEKYFSLDGFCSRGER